MGKSKISSMDPQILVKDSLLYRVRNSVGTQMFRRLYVRVDGKRKDILRDGNKSCALFVTTILVGFHLVEEVHVTVKSTIRDMEHSGWERILRPRMGCIVVWEVTNEQGASHLHIGFYVGHGQAISNSSKEGTPSVHPYRAHKVHSLYWTSQLD